jgi:hypothetical protein
MIGEEEGREAIRCAKIGGFWPNLKHPRTFQEKIAWIKLYYRNPTRVSWRIRFSCAIVSPKESERII